MKSPNLFEHGTLKNADSKYLYRGLREEEVDAGIRLIPKKIQTYEDLKLFAANASGFYESRNLGATLILHDQINGSETSGVSTSTDIGIAFGYALSSPANKQYIVVISRERVKLLGISEHIIKEKFPICTIPKPDDEEVILISETGIFPEEIIEKAYKITEIAMNIKI